MSNTETNPTPEEPSNDLDDATALILSVRVDEVFTPGAPAISDARFSGRSGERFSLFEAIRSPGSHAAIYGERGVGKTSLAAICLVVSDRDGKVAVRITCDSADDFHTIWQKFVDECQIYLASHPGHSAELALAMERAAEVLSADDLRPAHVRIALRHILTVTSVIVCIDEFDQLNDGDAIVLTANLIKMLSDKVEAATIIPIGVADNIETLIEGHQSIQRNLVQVRMPRMTREELAQIALRGLTELEMTTTPEALAFIASTPMGMPQYAHMLAQEGARQALIARRREVAVSHVLDGLRVGLSKLDHSLSSAYDRATYTAQKSNFKEVLLACALSDRDQFGFFAPADITDRYSMIVGKQVGVPTFNPHLIALASPDRGEILHQMGPSRKHRYRFSDPLMEPYVLMRGFDAGMITPDQMMWVPLDESQLPTGQQLLF